MPVFTVHCHTPLIRSFRALQVAGLFDLPLDQIESQQRELFDRLRREGFKVRLLML